ncbi:endopeptidase La [Marinomonas mediterranea]|uniref:Lon protease n=1 Tax=Marinomonas mediterranea (strain ATCC 700492 / JCM 21426 / NBRC 103028 / MMB-1) TaxID=717774 RepID=F2JWP3_MARM1|nr:endopeptidase La [Marinomonas mediterranea]ADZ91807.1 anti-sigma H sporulation factor, LonB [Marinomonas mediterranea MMB-1]WCN17900.1 endopeptidase La [Marinomonas mediterranea MMB-1]
MSNMLTLPMLPLRDVVVYPHMVLPLFVGRTKSIEALEAAMDDDKLVFLVAQQDASKDDPVQEDLYNVGTVAKIMQLLRLPDGTVKVLVEGKYRATLNALSDGEEFISATVDELAASDEDQSEYDAIRNALLKQLDDYVSGSKRIPSEVVTSVKSIDDLSKLIDSITGHMSLKLEDKQKVLELISLIERGEYLMGLMDGELDIAHLEKSIRSRVKKQMERSQREYYLNEQMKAIQKELGDMDEGGNELDLLQEKIIEAGMTEEATEKADAELKKLKMMSPMSAEATVVRGYIDWLISLPWKKRSKVRNDLAYAEKVLNQDHYGLQDVKERILEFLAVQQRVKKVKGPVLCLVGPPGVGKTSLGQSIAKAVNRKYVRMALGGVRDEAEIRGHRRTYIGSMPGKLLQKLAKVKVKNPLFLLDEIDKMGMDHRGDPASALLEVLDPEQNHTFNDHYLEVDYDLSDVMFICTSNSMNIPGPLLDRMEVIRIPGYTEDEKLNIAKRYLLPKQVKLAGLKDKEIALADDAVMDVVRYYTKEAGVRGLERELSKICRRVVKQQALSKDKTTVEVTSENLEDFSGVRKFSYGKAEDKNQIGQVTGLAWTSVGGELLTIEAAGVPGKGRHVKTGSLGDVMQESIQAALTVVRSRSLALGIDDDFHEKVDLHLHVPEGATPKDGPSAGIAMCTAMVSVLAKVPVKASVAMTGEITLRGEVLPIGGLKEKLLAAHRGGIKTVVIPKENARDLKEIPDNIVADMEIVPVKWIDEVLDVALEYIPSPKEAKTASTKEKTVDEQETVSHH